MPAYHLVIAPAARHDLEDIYQYGCRQWGKPQSIHYIETLKTQLWMLTEQPFLGVERSDLLPDIRSLPIQSHTVYYRVVSNRIEIIRVLHARQEPQRHLHD